MRLLPHLPRTMQLFTLAALSSLAVAASVGAQSQEPKPVLPATPVAGSEITAGDATMTGVSDASWQGPTWGVSVAWDPADWTVENEFIDQGYDGLQIGTPLSTVYLEAYEGFSGDAAACLAAAGAELEEREGVTEVVPLTGRPLPVADDVRGDAQLFGLTLTIPDGTVFRGVEYVECRSIVPGRAVLEITWQTITKSFNEDFPRIEKLLAAVTVSAAESPAATPIGGLATPVAYPVAPSPPESANAK